MKSGWKTHLMLIVLPLVKLLLHLATYRGYGMFRDESYYLACADHPALATVNPVRCRRGSDRGGRL